jgi:hypothetical protein
MSDKPDEKRGGDCCIRPPNGLIAIMDDDWQMQQRQTDRRTCRRFLPPLSQGRHCVHP